MKNIFIASKYLFVAAIISMGLVGSASAATLTENFDDPFVDWRSGYLGVNSNLENYYVDASGPGSIGNRGNNPFGIWAANGNGIGSDNVVDIAFDAGFASTLSSLSLFVGNYQPGVTLTIYDMVGATLLSSSVLVDNSIASNQLFSAISTNGIGGFRFSSLNQIEGFLNIDDVTAETSSVAPSPVPLPASVPMLAAGIGFLGFIGRRKKRSARA